jgi:uncharacterized lipoprotein YddW (UPF0748 family)
MHSTRHFFTLFIVLQLSLSLFAQNPPKREFRGTWVQTVGQTQYASMSEQQMKTYFINLLDGFQKTGINTILFQVRPEADAWYKSDLEPWSRFITGEQGKDPGWDPLAFLVEECHKRNIDFHAWLNPYRVSSSPSRTLAPNHIYNQHPEWFIKYGNVIMFDPGNPKCRAFIKKVVRDLVKRYDIDAIHMDDYFYPYPVAGKQFDDAKSFAAYGAKMGFKKNQRADWRRENVNILIRDLHKLIHDTKPWVEFGVSPFGIYRNKKQDPKGSLTNGLSNYDDLYADVLLWVKKGWIDYNIPQLYWEIGHKNADYGTLVDWWTKNNMGKPLYIGQDVLRMVKPDSLKRIQFKDKMTMVSESTRISGNCFWPGYEIINNAGNIKDSLQTSYYKYLALPPADNSYDQTPPKKVQRLKWKKGAENSRSLFWSAPTFDQEMDKATYYVVYRFKKVSDINLQDPRNMVKITRETTYEIPATDEGHQVFVITAVDRCHNESLGEVIELK